MYVIIYVPNYLFPHSFKVIFIYLSIYLCQHLFSFTFMYVHMVKRGACFPSDIAVKCRRKQVSGQATSSLRSEGLLYKCSSRLALVDFFALSFATVLCDSQTRGVQVSRKKHETNTVQSFEEEQYLHTNKYEENLKGPHFRFTVYAGPHTTKKLWCNAAAAITVCLSHTKHWTPPQKRGIVKSAIIKLCIVVVGINLIPRV